MIRFVHYREWALHLLWEIGMAGRVFCDWQDTLVHLNNHCVPQPYLVPDFSIIFRGKRHSLQVAEFSKRVCMEDALTMWFPRGSWYGLTRSTWLISHSSKSENSLSEKSSPESALCWVSKLLLFSSIFRLLELLSGVTGSVAFWKCWGHCCSCLRGCLCKNHPLNLKKKKIPKTLVIERTYWDYSRNSFGLVQKKFLVALGAVENFDEPGSVGRGKKLKIWHFSQAVCTKVGPNWQLASIYTEPQKGHANNKVSNISFALLFWISRLHKQ